ncbi:MAG TPA: CaiB/BaiF CoA-transferase family protein, partial [Chloroflexota bacterium]|nr:CaiB/BaiF CoA-transferase family protein [Chloroflexota bacterium]
FSAALLADFGADVIKAELPGQGDTLRNVAPMYADRSLYWSVLGRNKCSITLDLRVPRGRELFLRLVERSDVVIENFRPGTLERWKIGYDVLKATNPDVVLVRVSGYGQDGPYKDKAGFGTPAAAIGGLTYITGYPDRPPITVPIALADYLAGLFGALSATMGLLERERNRKGGQWVDVSLYESVFRLLEPVAAAYGKLGRVRERQGNRTGQSSPIGTYRTADDRYIVLSVSTDRVWLRMTEAMGHPEWAADARFASNPLRAAHADDVDAVVGDWVAQHSAAEAQQILDDAGVPVSPIYSMADIYADVHYQARGDVIRPVDPELGEVPMPGIIPKFSRTPGSVRFVGPKLGEHNQAIYGDLLGLSPDEMETLRAEGVI